MTPPATRSSTHRRGGFTLLELLIVGTLGTILVMFITNAWIWYARTTRTMHVTAQLNRELKIAATAIAQDFGPALAARTTDGTDLQFDYDYNSDAAAQWAAPDGIVQYILDNGRLVRRDLITGVNVPLASSITNVAAELVDGQLSVHLTATYQTTTQDLTLELRDPS
jgi:type II secretory pathway component PulJ